jgi:hypothetical protein
MDGVKKAVKSVKKAIKAFEAPARSQELLNWQKKLEVAKAGQDLTLMDKREYLYMGDPRVDRNINSATTPQKSSNNVYNIVYEFIESQVSSQIPMPQVKSKREGFEQQAQMIGDAISNDLKESNIETINDQNERITPLQGFSLVEVCWNPDYQHHLYKGEVELYGRHPKQLVGQPKVYSLQKMDFFFILSDVSHDYVWRRYNKNLDGEQEQYPENTRLYDAGTLANSGITQRSGGEEDQEPLTEIVCWYKDDNGDYGKFVWINDIELENLPRYFYRRINGKIVEEETLTDDVMGQDENGQPIKIASAGEKVPYFVPTRYPVSVRINVPRNFAFGGQSDMDVIRDQQDSIKRVVHKMEEKIVRGGSIIKALEDHSSFDKVTDEIYQIVKGSQAELMAIGTLDLTADISKDLTFVQEMYKFAQSMLGVTNSFQGKPDDTAISGVAKQIQVQQASGRMQSKAFNKYVHYKEIFEIMFQFKLAFYDEPRPYMAQDVNGQDTYGHFDKYQLLQRDKTGQLYYNTDFVFGSDGSAGLPKDPMFLFNQALAFLQAQALDVVQFWSLLESLQFPQASKFKKQWEQKMQQQQQDQGQQQQYETQIQQDQQKIQADAQEMEVLNEMVKLLTEAVKDAQAGDVQATNQIMQQLEQVQEKEHSQGLATQGQQMQAQQQQQGADQQQQTAQNQMQMHQDKMALEHRKLDVAQQQQKQVVKTNGKNSQV